MGQESHSSSPASAPPAPARRRLGWGLSLALVALILVVWATISIGRQTIFELGAERRIPDAHPGGVLAVALIGDSVVLTSGVDGSAAEWEVATGRLRKRFVGPAYRFPDAAIFANGTQALTPTAEGDGLVWDTKTGAAVRRLGGRNTGTTLVAASRIGDLGATAALDRAITIWRLGDGTPVMAISPHEGRVVGLALVNDQIFSAGDEETVCIQRASPGSASRCFPVASDGIASAAFSPDGSRIATGSRTGSIKIWRADGSLSQTMGQAAEVTSLELDGTGQRLLAGSRDSAARLLDVTTGEVLARFSLAGYASAVALSPDASVAVIGASSGEVVITRLRWPRATSPR